MGLDHPSITDKCAMYLVKDLEVPASAGMTNHNGG
jgi:hypothetical protein